ncbi:hypothetical protein F3Y22_tig00110548pilonHSYRG00105 [Hibiscus syriacus]|uniref:Integrase catalytic domain-containing protein n=1 Tax=Hibiscus syriacus TaxID=106335 RepID=A0A6A3ABK5_HIBSY|nr:hypothetical protein F3Y22_tig00110548pilonHSYRG00105 [Hibiscus syriacus]
MTPQNQDEAPTVIEVMETRAIAAKKCASLKDVMISFEGRVGRLEDLYNELKGVLDDMTEKVDERTKGLESIFLTMKTEMMREMKELKSELLVYKVVVLNGVTGVAPSPRPKIDVPKLKEFNRTQTAQDNITEIKMQILDLGELEEFFAFMDGLQRWANMDIQRKGVTKISKSLDAVEAIAHLKHMMRDCPHLEKVASIKEDDGQYKETMKLTSILSSMEVKKGRAKKGLMFVDIIVVGYKMSALVNTGASELLMSEQIVKKHDILVEKASGFIKTINSKEALITGVVRGVELDIIGWNDKETLKSIECQKAFKRIKEAMVSEPILVFLDYTKPFEIFTDAFDVSIGGVLMQDGHLVVYKSWKLNETEMSYRVQAWKGELCCDGLSRRYTIEMMEVICSIESRKEYKPGKVNCVVDGLSRRYTIEMMEGYLLHRIKEGQYGKLDKERMKECHDSNWAGHPVVDHTMTLLAEKYYWLHMAEDVRVYVKTCLPCQQNKVEMKKPTRLLQPFLIPERPWECFSMDFNIDMHKRLVWRYEGPFQAVKLGGCTDDKRSISGNYMYLGAFKRIKEAMGSELVLVFLDYTKRFEIFIDAFNVSIGGILMQDGHLVAFKSRKLNETEKRYSIHEKEMTTVVHCLRIWRHYLLGSWFVVFIDNVANSYFLTQKKLSPKQAGWQEFFDEFDFFIEYKPGKVNCVVDGLSRSSFQFPSYVEAARLFLKHAVKYRGVPKTISSDRDTWFTGRFWIALFKLMGSSLNFSIICTRGLYEDMHKRLVWRYEGPFQVVKQVGTIAYRLELPPTI